MRNFKNVFQNSRILVIFKHKMLQKRIEVLNAMADAAERLKFLVLEQFNTI